MFSALAAKRAISTVTVMLLSMLFLLGLPAIALSSDTLEYPVILIPGTFGCWNQSTWESMVKNMANIHDRPLTERAVAQALNYISQHNIIEQAQANIASDEVKSTAEKLYTIDYQALQLDHQGDAVWYLEPIDSSYAGFFKLLTTSKENGGYGLTHGSDFFVYCYDTMGESLQSNASHLSDFVDAVLAKTNSPKVQLIGHSQGGLVARYYIQNLGGWAKTSNLVMVATPNHGAIAAFDVAKSGEYSMTSSSLFSYVRSMMKEDESSLLKIKLDPAGNQDLAMDMILWTALAEFPKVRQAYLTGIERQARYQGEISPLYAMLPQFDFIVRRWSDLKLEVDESGSVPRLRINRKETGIKTEIQEGLGTNDFLNEVLNSSQGLAELARVPRVTTVIAQGIETAEYVVVKGEPEEVVEFADAGKFSSSYSIQVTNQGDGVVLDKSASLEELGRVKSHITYQHRTDLPPTPHNSYFKDADALSRWIASTLSLD